MSLKQEKLLKQYDQWNKEQFKRIYLLWEQKFSRSQSLEEFLAYLTVNEVLDVEEYSLKINNIIDVDLNKLTFNRKAQEDLTKATIHKHTMDLVQHVNDDFKEHLRTQAAEAFDKGVSPQEFGRMIKAPPLVKGEDGAKRSVSAEVRNHMIARTEAKRALNVSNYLINKERGATHWYAIGFTDDDTCTRCIETYGTPGNYKYYPIDETEYLPPLHPNCRHTAVFVKKEDLEGEEVKNDSPPSTNTTITEPTNDQLKQNLTAVERANYANYKRTIKSHEDWLKNNPNAPIKQINNHKEKLSKAQLNLDELIKKALGEKLKEPPKSEKVTEEKSNLKPPFDKSKHLTKEQLDEMDFKQLAEHHEVKYEGVKVYDYDKRKYHTFKQTFDDGHEFTLRFEEGAVKSYTNKGIATPNEIIHEVFKVPEVLRKETREIWFKNTNHGIQHTYTKSGYDTLGPRDGGYNLFYDVTYIKTIDDTDFNHRIVINPKYFKGGGKGKYAFIWEHDPNDARDWKMTIHHEFTHSGDQPKILWEELKTKELHYIVENDRLSVTEEYKQIHQEEPYFTNYANSEQKESYAEHGGYIARMESNPSEQSKKIKVTVLENGEKKQKSINYEEYKQLYPKHHDYFMRKFKEGFKK